MNARVLLRVGAGEKDRWIEGARGGLKRKFRMHGAGLESSLFRFGVSRILLRVARLFLAKEERGSRG